MTVAISPLALLAHLDEQPPIPWSEDLVRDRLPEVEVQLPDGSIEWGQIHGRANRFATVVIEPAAGVYIRNEFAWATIVNALNAGHSLKI